MGSIPESLGWLTLSTACSSVASVRSSLERGLFPSRSTSDHAHYQILGIQLCSPRIIREQQFNTMQRRNRKRGTPRLGGDGERGEEKFKRISFFKVELAVFGAIAGRILPNAIKRAD